MLAPIGVKLIRGLRVRRLVLTFTTTNFPPSNLPILNETTPDGSLDIVTVPLLLVEDQIITGGPDGPQGHTSEQ
jgi:hypothetical protein